MFVEDVKAEFYNLITGKRLLVLVNLDVDAICSCKILQHLFKTDNTLYTLQPVQSVQDLKDSFDKHSKQIKHILLINCGGSIDIVETLQPSDDVTFFVIDSHKPTDVCNIYSITQVRLLAKPEDDENIPEFEDIFLNSDSEEEGGSNDDEEEEESESGAAKRARLGEEQYLKRRQRREWEAKRNKLMFEYSQFSYYSRSCSMVTFEILWKLGKDTVDALWWAIVGVTYQMLTGLVIEHKYSNELTVLHLHMSRLIKTDTCIDNDNQIIKLPTLKITSQKDLRLALYRHWTVQESLRNSLCTAIKLKLWTIRGEKYLRKLLAEIGLPLNESKQRFSAMDVTLRNDFLSMMEKVASTYDIGELIYTSFTLTFGYRKSFQAADYVYGMSSLLEPSSRNKGMGVCFSEALESLSRNKSDLLELGIEHSKRMLSCIFKRVQSLLDLKQVISAGPFLYFVLQEGSLDVKMFSESQGLGMLARYTLQAYHSISRNRKSGCLPLIASAPSYPLDDTCLILGIPPVSEVIPRNFFGKAFSQAAEMINIEPQMTYFDSAVIRMMSKDRAKFFDALATILS